MNYYRNYVDFWPRRDSEPPFQKFSKTHDFGDDGGRVGGIHVNNPPFVTFKECIYGGKKFEGHTEAGETTLPFPLPFHLPFPLPFHLPREKWVLNLGALWVK